MSQSTKMTYMRNAASKPEGTTVVKEPKLPKALAPSRERDNPLRDHAASHHGYSGSRSFQHGASRMTFGLKALFSIAPLLFVIAPLLFVVTPSTAADVTYKDYTNASSEIWKRGFVLGISQYMAAVAQPDEEAPYPVRNAYQRCLAGSTDVLLVRQVDAYVAKNFVSANEPMVRVVIRALFNLCRSEIEKVKPSKAAPSPQAK
jgi:hypothetical protein